VGWFAEAANEGITAPKNVGKNLKRAGGGVVSTVKLVTGTVAGAATLAWDAASMSVNDAAADRMVARGQAISNFAANPIDSVVGAHNKAADAILAAEGSGDYIGSGQAAAGIAQADFLAVYGATALGRAAVTRMTPAVVLEEGAYTPGWFTENPLLSASGSPAAVPAAAAFSGGAHGSLSTRGVERHHMPADSISPVSTARGPAIEMVPADHMLTASWGRSRAAMSYRARQQQLIAEGRYVEAIQMDINDAHVLFGSKYDGAIQQMLDYASTLRPSQMVPRAPSKVKKR
jgi:hypothetical protein